MILINQSVYKSVSYNKLPSTIYEDQIDSCMFRILKADPEHFKNFPSHRRMLLQDMKKTFDELVITSAKTMVDSKKDLPNSHVTVTSEFEEGELGEEYPYIKVRFLVSL